MGSMSCLLSLAVLAFGLGFQHSEGAGWSYEGEHGVTHWPVEFSTCAGSRQSPIDLVTASAQYDSTMGPFIFTNFDTVAYSNWTIVNNGHTVQVNYNNDDSLHVSGGGLRDVYSVAQFHFHWGSNDSWGSEHTVNGKHYPMEMHVVTWKRDYGSFSNAMNYSDGLAVLGFFFETLHVINPVFNVVVRALGEIVEPDSVAPMEPFPLESLLPETADFYRYLGSLTTPPCSEVVIWTIFRDTIKISPEQIQHFRFLKSAEVEPDGSQALMEANFRPVQPLLDRQIKASFNECEPITEPIG